MTELYIAGVSVVLPKNLNIAVKRENPFFTKSGEYTYDITLDLDNPINVELYKHLYRLNSVDEITEKRPAVLIADNRVYCNGTEIITGWTNRTVTIQVASGNSELNYFIGSDLLISSLDIYNKGFTPNIQYVEKLYPEIEFCLAPVHNRTADFTLNFWRYNYITDSGVYNLLLKDNYQDGDYIAQPFLCSFINCLLKALGYTLTDNDIAKSEWKDLFIPHLNNTTKWQEMVPGWTVGDFLGQIELLFNASFIIDSKTKEVRLLFNNSFYSNSPRAHVTQIVDEYEGDIDEEPSEQIQYANIRYNFPDTAYFRAMSIPEQTYKAMKKGVIPLSWAEENQNASRGYRGLWFQQDDSVIKDVIFYDEKSGNEYIAYTVDSETEGLISKTYRLVNVFKPIIRSEDGHTIELDIMPVEMGDWDWWQYYNGKLPEGGSFEKKPTEWIMVTIDGNDVEGSDEEEQLFDKITGSVTESSPTKGPVFLAFHKGLNASAPNRGSAEIWPYSFTFELFSQRVFSTYGNKLYDGTLSLQRFEDQLYSNGYEIDTSRSIVFTSYDPNLFDPRSIFECRNKIYVCREMEYTLNNQGRAGAWKGTFHSLKISDTEAYQRWILEDGKWRDGGTWLENGRWLDE